MKKTIIMVYLMIISLSVSSAFAADTDKKKTDPAIPEKTENKLSDEEIKLLTNRVEEIRDMDKSNLTAKERKALRKELREIKENVQRNGGYIYIGAGTLLVILLIVILLV
jgi:hypothetical protein